MAHGERMTMPYRNWKFDREVLVSEVERCARERMALLEAMRQEEADPWYRPIEADK